MQLIDLAPEQMIDDEDDNYIDQVYQKQQKFTSEFNSKVQSDAFDNDWLNK